MIQIGINVGFITNSSSVVYHFPREVFENPLIQDFLQKFELQDGYLGDDLWSRGSCSSLAVTKEQKAQLVTNFFVSYEDWHPIPPGVNTKDDSVVLVYSDEYTDLTSVLLGLLQQVAVQMTGNRVGGDQYN